jgi:hypothetical protein
MKTGRLRKIEVRASEQDRPDEWYWADQERRLERERRERRLERAAPFHMVRTVGFA